MSDEAGAAALLREELREDLRAPLFLRVALLRLEDFFAPLLRPALLRLAALRELHFLAPVLRAPAFFRVLLLRALVDLRDELLLRLEDLRAPLFLRAAPLLRAELLRAELLRAELLLRPPFFAAAMIASPVGVHLPASPGGSPGTARESDFTRVGREFSAQCAHYEFVATREYTSPQFARQYFSYRFRVSSDLVSQFTPEFIA